MISMIKKTFNLTSLSQKLGECYVARIENSGKILAHAKNAKTLMEKVKNIPEFKRNKVVISWVPKYGARYVFGVSLPPYSAAIV